MNDLINLGLESLLPAGIVALFVLIVMIQIAIKRHHSLVVLTSAIGLNAALIAVILQFFGMLPVHHQVGVLFTIDGFSLINTAIILICALACMTFCHSYFSDFKDHKEELYLLMLVATLGAILMASSNHFASFFMALELLSVPMYGMLAYSFLKPQSLESGIKYLVLSATASATLLMGMAFVYTATGSLSFGAIREVILLSQVSPLLIVGAVMMVVAIGFKLSLAPFHSWVADVYAGASSPVVAFLASVSKIAVVAGILRLLISSAAPALLSIDSVLVFMSVLSVFFGNLLALYQNNIKRMLAFSSIAHMGYVLMVLLSSGETASITTTMYMLIYGLTGVAAFGVVSLLSGTINTPDADHIDNYRGLFWRRPVLTAVLTVMLLSMAGIPLTAGFMTKMQVLLSLVQGGRFYLAGVLIIGSAVGLYYYLKTLSMMFKKPAIRIDFDVADDWKHKSSGVVIIAIMVLIVFWGILPSSLFDFTSLAQIR